MTLRPYKFLVQPIAQDVDDEGRVLREVPVAASQDGQPITVFGVDGLREFADGFAVQLKEI